MPVPSTGEISLGKIGKELRSTGTGDDYDNGPDTQNATSLTQASTGAIDALNTSNSSANRPDGSTPHNMSEFYSYDHNLAGLSPPSALSYISSATNTIQFTFDEPAGATRVYFFQGPDSSITGWSEGSHVVINGAQYATVNASSTTSVTVGGSSSDRWYNPSIPSEQMIVLGPNDYLDLKYKSYDGSTFSGFSNSIRGWTLPGSATNPNQSAAETDEVEIEWDEPTGGANSYQIFFGPNVNPTGNMVSGSQEIDLRTGLTAGATYYFRVRAVNGGGNLGAYSANFDVQTLPATPTGLTGTGFTTSVDLDWNDNAIAPDNYTVQYKLSTAMSYTTFATVTASEDLVTGLSSGLTYNFRVKANNGAGSSGYATTTVSTSGGGGGGKKPGGGGP